VLGTVVPLITLFTACICPFSAAANTIDDPFVGDIFDEPDAITNSPLDNDDVTLVRASKLPRLCLIICAIF
jgi:hypothetical protein